MTTLLTAPPPLPVRRRPDARAVLAGGVALAGVALVVAVAGLLLDDRTITGAPAWLKPTKFAISTGAYLMSLRWVVSLLPPFRGRVVLSLAVVAALAGELSLIDLQVLRGTSSHFNTATAGDTAVFDAMGGLISLVFLATLVLGVRALRTAGLDVGLAAGLRWGLGVCLLGMTQAGTMFVNTSWSEDGGHTVGAPDGGPGLPGTQWSTLHGDLRIGHFVGLHALQALPLLAWVLARHTGLPGRVRARLLAVAGAAQAGLVLLLSWQALRGQPLLHPDGATLLALAALVALAGCATARVLRVGSPSTLPGQVLLPAGRVVE